jgi:hypothetical protein
VVVSAGNEHDSWRFEHVVISARINIVRGSPITRPGKVFADAAYDTESIRCYLRRNGIGSSIPSNKRNQNRLFRGDTLDLATSHARNEAELSDYSNSSNSDSGEIL